MQMLEKMASSFEQTKTDQAGSKTVENSNSSAPASENNIKENSNDERIQKVDDMTANN